MKFVVFNDDRVGLLEEERILDLGIAPNADSKVFSSLASLINEGPRGLDLVRAIADDVRGSDLPGLWTDISEVQLRAPWPGGRFALAGANNADHMASAFSNMGTPRTADEVRTASRNGAPNGFWGQSRPVMGPGAEIEIPSRANGYFDYEGEPAVIFGKQGKDIQAENFAGFVWGFTLVNDWSIREPVWPPRLSDLWAGVKNFDCSKSIGPCIVVDEVHIDNFPVETLVNGQLRQSFQAGDMIYSFAEVLEYLSADFTIFPGDVLSGGTGAGTGIDQTVPNEDGSWPQDLFLRPGDQVEVRSREIGSLVNTVVSKRT
jgi:2-keto-4-pentenoate hydratase/2-oxohepta-3-ene-1,7-dioic acid hydratase in catechol pathway